MRLIVRKLVYFPIDIWNSLFGKRHKFEPPKGDIYIGSGDFITQGKHQLDLLIEHANIKPNDTVLDVGSGIGRTAVPLTEYLSDKGKYEGFDVVEKGVKWCNSKIKKHYPNFNFTYVPLNNDLYNTNTKKASNFKFPYNNNTFDKVFLFSVFTHMSVAEIANYLKEIKRVLKPDGICLSTFFTYNSKENKNSSEIIQKTFPIDMGNYKLMNKEVTCANIALSEKLLDKIIQEANLIKVKSIEGYWKNNVTKYMYNDFQDTIIMKA